MSEGERPSQREASPAALLAILSSPSGGGKTTIIRRILSEGDDRYRRSVSVTTRKRRAHEKHGQDYYFISRSEFQRLIDQGQLLEYEKVHTDYYGTPKQPVLEWMAQGKIIFFDIDVKGAFSLRKLFPQQSLLIFIRPPDLATLRRRLTSRQSESARQIEKRLQRAAMEMEYGKAFDYTVVNDDLERAVAQVKNIINQHLQKGKTVTE